MYLAQFTVSNLCCALHKDDTFLERFWHFSQLSSPSLLSLWGTHVLTFVFLCRLSQSTATLQSPGCDGRRCNYTSACVLAILSLCRCFWICCLVAGIFINSFSID